MTNKKKEGPFHKYYQNRYSGKLKEKGSYKEGKLDGLWEEFYENGNLKTKGVYSRYIPVGTWEYFSENGSCLRKKNFNNKGEEQGFFEYYHQNGLLEVRGYREKDDLTGLYEEYYSNGQLSQRGNFKEGSRVGEWDYFLENGVSVDQDYYFSYKQDLLEESLETPEENKELEKQMDFVLAAGYYVFHADNEIPEREPNTLKRASFIKELNKWREVCGKNKADEFHREYILSGLDKGISTGKQYEYLDKKVNESSARMKHLDKITKIFAIQTIIEIVSCSGFVSDEELQALKYVSNLIDFDMALVQEMLRIVE